MFKFPQLLFLLIFYAQNISAQTSDWTGYVSYDDANNVLQQEGNLSPCEFIKNGVMRIENPATPHSTYWTNFKYRASFCLTDNFTYEMRVKNTAALGGIPAYDLAIEMLMGGGTIGFALMGLPAAQQYTYLYINNETLAQNTPALVVDMTDWGIVKLVFKDNNLSFYYNNKLFFTKPYTAKVCNMAGFNYRLKGAASVDWVRVTDNQDDAIIYFEDFLDCNNLKKPTGCNPSVSALANNPCEGDSLKLTTNTRATSYEWSGPNGFSSSKPSVVIPKTNQSSGGTYFLKAQLNACQLAENTVAVSVKSLPKVALGNDTFACNGQILTLDARNDGGTYKWQNGTSNRYFGVKNTGNYAVTVTNTEGCRAADTVNVVVAATPILPGITTQKPTCFGKCDGSVAANAAGGFGAPYAYTWTGGRNTATVMGRCAGDISLTVTDSRGCKIVDVASVSPQSKVVAKVIPSLNFNGFAVRCPKSEDGEATVMPTGGSGGYTYVWDTNPWQLSKTATGLKADTTYKVFVLDKNRCVDSTTVKLTAPPPIESQFSVKSPRCFGDKNASIQLDNIRGGIAPYSFIFEEKKYKTDSIRQFKNLPSGEYRFEIKDTNQCSVEKKILIKDPPKLIYKGISDTLIHFGDDVLLMADLETPSVLGSVTWIPMRDSNGLVCRNCPETIASPRLTTSYKVLVSDTFGCSLQKTFLVRVDKLRKIFVPNTFSPNNDEKNDVFMLYAGKGTRRILNFSVFNRWGSMIFQVRDFAPNDETKSWNGTYNGENTPLDTYIWCAEIEFEDGEREVFKGDVTIMR